jgi:hypothetical protein
MRIMMRLASAACCLLICLATASWAGWVTQESTTTQDLNTISLLTDVVGFAAGGNGVLVKTTDGLTWAARATGTTNTINDIVAVSSREI